MVPYGALLLSGLFTIFDKPGSKENEHAMKGLIIRIINLITLC